MNLRTFRSKTRESLVTLSLLSLYLQTGSQSVCKYNDNIFLAEKSTKLLTYYTVYNV